MSPLSAFTAASGSATPREWGIGGGWGDRIEFTNTRQFDAPITCDSKYQVAGWKREKPKKGDILIAEFERSWMHFAFVEVTNCADPADMFFATVAPIKQVMKSPNNKMRDAANG